MPAANNPSDEATDYSQLDKEQSTTKTSSRHTNAALQSQAESRSTQAATTTHPIGHDSQTVKPHTDERGSRKASSDTLSGVTIATTTATTTTTTTTSTDRHRDKARSGTSNRNPEATSGDPLGSPEHEHHARDQEKSSNPTSNTSRSSMTRVQISSQGRTQNDHQHHQGATEDTSARGSAAHPSARRPQDTQVLPGHHSEDEQQDRTLETRQSTTPQASGRGWGVVDNIMSTFIPTGATPPPKDKYLTLKDENHRIRDELRQAHTTIARYDHELRKKNGELHYSQQHVGYLEQEKQRAKDIINGLQNELNNIHHQLEDAKNLSEIRGKELVGAQVFLTKADTISISEVGEKVTALNEEIFQAAATLGEALIYKRHEVSQTEWEAAAAVSKEMVGEKMTNILITQSQKPELEVNPLLVQVVLQIFMIKFCVSKIQSWYPDPTIEGFLSAIYSDIRSTEEQAVSGRWRALIRARTRPTTETWKDEFYEKLQSLLKIASWTLLSSDHGDSYGNRLPSIFKAINELRIAIGENFTSADLDISVFECDKLYDPANMEDAYGDDRQSSGKRAPETIVGTTGIGLEKIIAERSAKDVLQVQTLIRPKIVLTSTLIEALEPIQPSRLKKKKKPVENAKGADPEGCGGSKSKADGDTEMIYGGGAK